MLREFQEEIAKLKEQLASAATGSSSDGSADAAIPSADAHTRLQSAIADTWIDPEELERMRQHLETELRTEYSNSGMELDDEALAQMKQEVEMQLVEQVKQAQAEQQRADTEAARLAKQLEQQAAQVQHEAERMDQEHAHNAELAAKLRMLESKLLHGEQRGGLDSLANQTAAQLNQQEDELKKERTAAVQASRHIAVLEASAHTAQAQYSSLQEEANALTSQLDSAAGDYEAARAEQGDVYAQWELDREDLVEEIRSLHYSLALKNLVIDAFIPQEEVSKLLRCATYNSSEGSWSLGHKGAGRAKSAALPKRPASAALRADGATQPKMLLLELQLDVPERKLLDFASLQQCAAL